MANDVEARLRRIEDQLAIYQVVAAHPCAIDGRSGETLGELYVENGAYAVGDTGRFEGRAGVQAMASSPGLAKLLEGGAASEYLRVARPGDRMDFRGPFGVFTLADSPGPFWFLGTGTGLAPYRSMLEEVARAKDPRSFRLLFGVRDEEDVFAVDHLDRLRETLPDFDYTLCLSRPSPAWTGFKGRITQRLADTTPDTSAHVYLCGNGPMIDEGRAILTAAGFDRKHVHFEKYY